MAFYDPRYPSGMPYKDISAHTGVKYPTVCKIIHDYKYGLLDFNIKENDREPSNKKMNDQMLKFIFDKVVAALKNRESISYKKLQEMIK